MTPPDEPAVSTDANANRTVAEPQPIVYRVAAPPIPAWLEIPDGIAVIGPISGERRAREQALVLQSQGVSYTRRHTDAGWVLWVAEADYRRATRAIERFNAENADWPPREAPEKPAFPFSIALPLAFFALVLFFGVTGPVSDQGVWFQRGSSVAELVVSSAPWRAITALTLHADSSHVLGNAVSGSLFGVAVSRRLGAGGGALAVVAAGALGNLANAAFYAAQGTAHGSIGASTAVFGAVGILTATQVLLDRASPDEPRRKRSWLDIGRPIAGGLALLATLGASPQSDLGAHLFGFLSGLVVGLAFATPLLLTPKEGGTRRGTRPELAKNPLVQVVLGALALGIVIGAWQLAWMRA